MDVGNTKQSAERVFFIVDRTRLKEETDELKDAIVMYVPDGELQKVRINVLQTFFVMNTEKIAKAKSYRKD